MTCVSTSGHTPNMTRVPAVSTEKSIIFLVHFNRNQISDQPGHQPEASSTKLELAGARCTDARLYTFVPEQRAPAAFALLNSPLVKSAYSLRAQLVQFFAKYLVAELQLILV